MCLAPEAGEPLQILRDLGREHLDRHVAAEVRVGGAVHLAPPPGPEGGGDPVVGQGLSDHTTSPGAWPPS